MPATRGPQTADDGTPYFDPECFTQEDGRIHYAHGNFATARTGVDVSDHQGHIDWEAVAADGIDFAIIRIGYRGTTEGKIHADATFAINLMEAQAAGIECGVYFFSQATSIEEAKEEADFVLEHLAGNKLEYPIVFDYESTPDSRIAGVDATTAARAASTYCRAVRAAGYYPMIYGNAYDLEKMAYGRNGDPALWFAEYGPYPKSSHESEIWQYTSEGYVDGIETNVDLNLDLGYDDWEREQDEQ